MWETINSWVSFLANWLELIGFAIVVFTGIKVFFLNRDVKRLHNKYLFQTRISEHLVELKATSKSIANALGDFSGNRKDIRLEISQCLVNCQSISKKVDKSQLTSLPKTIKSAKAIIKNKLEFEDGEKWWNKLLGRKPIEERDIDGFYEILTTLIKEIEHLDTDLKRTLS